MVHSFSLASWLALLATVPANGTPATGEFSSRERTAPSPSDVLARAFANRYDCDTAAVIELVMKSRSGGERRRVFHTLSKRKDRRLRSIGRLIEPASLRGMTVMTIEVPGRSEETYIYLPSMGRVRRVSSAQRGDSFLGSDLTYEDFERRRVEDFEIESLVPEQVAGEAAYRVRARPRRGQSYDHVDFVIAQSDWALLATRYFKRGAESPFRVIEAPRAAMVRRDGHVLPTQLRAHNVLRGTTTEIVLSELRVNPEIDERLFSVKTLEQRGALE